MLKFYSHGTYKYNGLVKYKFETKFIWFNDRCDQANIPHEKRHLAFSAMLTSAAINSSFSHVKNTCFTVLDMENKIRKRFITQECVLALTQEWEYATLLDYQVRYQGKCLSEVFNLLLDRLQELQLCIPSTFHSDDLLKNRLLNA